jgi:hypothetical protein
MERLLAQPTMSAFLPSKNPVFEVVVEDVVEDIVDTLSVEVVVKRFIIPAMNV